MKKKIVRTMRADFISGQILPANLAVLRGVRFFAVTERTWEKRHKFRIEILPGSLKKLVDKAKRNETLEAACAAAVAQNEQLQKEKEELQHALDKEKDHRNDVEAVNVRLKRNNARLMRNIEESGSDTERRPGTRMKNYLQVAEEMGFKVHGHDVGAGAPGLGKR